MKKKFAILIIMLSGVVVNVFLLAVLTTEGILSHADLWKIIFASAFGAVIVEKLIK